MQSHSVQPRPRLIRPVAGVVAMFALVLQLVLPGMAQARLAASGDWIEICSEAGAVWVQVEFASSSETGDSQHAPCPKCSDCAFCVVGGPAALTEVAQLSGPAPAICVLVSGAGSRTLLTGRKYERPMTRGPPAAQETRADDRARGAFTAFHSKDGGAL